ncbi:MAG: porin [Sulfitobacter sp.]|nr:porin [Sulfitobacter sp.]
MVATAGVAAADVTFGGYGRFGVMYNEAAVDNEFNVTSRFRLEITATAESDAGVTFGAYTRIEQNDNNQPGFVSDNGLRGVRFFAKSGGLEVGVGNIQGALEFMPGMYPIDLGLTGLGYNYVAYNFRGDAIFDEAGDGAAGDNGVEVKYAFGDLSVHVSASERNSRIAAHAAYTYSGWTFALGLQNSDDVNDSEMALSVGGSFGPADVTLAYAKNGDAGDHIVLAGRFDVGAATNIEVYVADADYFAETSYGIDFNHDMGGGTSLRGGVASLNSGNVRADLGVRFNF